MPEFLVLSLCGLIGALMYSFPVLIAALKAVPPGRFAWTSMTFSVVVGAACAPIFVPLLGAWKPFLVQPEPYPLALGIGLAINPLTPIVLRRVLAVAEATPIGSSK
jgi:hypothetical protein